MQKLLRSFYSYLCNQNVSQICSKSPKTGKEFIAKNYLQSYIAMSSKKLVAADRIKDTEENVWVEFIQLALDYNPINLGQGFPDFAAPSHITKALSDAVLSDNVLLNQYTRGYGHPRLVKALGKYFNRLVQRNIDPQTEILVTVGAYESLYCAILGNVNPGDEVIIIEPFFDAYEPMVIMAGGIPVFIPLKPSNPGSKMSSNEWILDPEELSSKFNSKTKAIIVNTPHNPLGKVFNRHELDMIADLAKKWDTLVIMDEVYEWVVFDGTEHVRMATLPDMWQRTLTIGSAGKTFSITGWKVGWTYGPKNLIAHSFALHQNCIYTITTPIQEAIAVGFEIEMERLEKPDSYFVELSTMLQEKRNIMVKMLEGAGMVPVVPEGGYFILADYSKIGEETKASFLGEKPPELFRERCEKFDFDDGGLKAKDHKFSRWLTIEKKLAAIPPSSFYSHPHKHLAENYVRFCFMKNDSTLKAAEEILLQLKNA